MIAGIREVLVISTPRDLLAFKELLGDGAEPGMRFEYAEQAEPRRLAEAFTSANDFLVGEPCALDLGDNMFHGQGLTREFKRVKEKAEHYGGAVVFGYPVQDARAFGMVEFDEDCHIVGIEEKPGVPKSNYAVPGLYFYDGQVSDIAANVKPSARGELEITSINNAYLEQGQLSVELMGRGMTWLDTGTPEGLLKAAEYVEAVQSRQGYYIACLKEIAYRRSLIDSAALRKLGDALEKTAYGKYLPSVSDEVKRG